MSCLNEESYGSDGEASDGDVVLAVASKNSMVRTCCWSSIKVWLSASCHAVVAALYLPTQPR